MEAVPVTTSGLSKKQWKSWAHGHRGKVRFATRREALKVAMRMRWRHRSLKLRLQAYRCTWVDHPSPRKGGAPHWHLGNSKRHPFRKPHRFILKHTLWRYYRVRLAWRVWRGTAQHPPPPRMRHDHGPELNCMACYYSEPSQWSNEER
jgi:hypothetical protein